MTTKPNATSAARRFIERLRRRRPSRKPLNRRQEGARAAESLALLQNPAFQAAYSNSFERGIDALMRLDPVSDTDRIRSQLIELRALESLALSLNSFVTTAELDARRREKQQQQAEGN